MNETILQVEDLRVQFNAEEGVVKAVDGVDFSVHRGETLGIVGESGSGKSVTNLAVLGLVPQPPGKIVSGRALFQGRDLLKMRQRELAKIRGAKIAMIFQDPMTSLNPLLSVAEQLTEVTRQHLKHTRRQALDHAVTMLERVGIVDAGKRIHSYPHQFSGGMRQRVMIAMALSCKPDLLIADEPTTALDVTIQAQFLELMQELQRAEGTAIILITHDLGVIASACHRVHVMYAGRIVEEADTAALFEEPCHPYTLGLLESIPRLDEAATTRLHPIVGQPPDLANLPPGCAFRPRCPFAFDRCQREDPRLAASPHGGRHACFADVKTAARKTTPIEAHDG